MGKEDNSSCDASEVVDTILKLKSYLLQKVYMQMLFHLKLLQDHTVNATVKIVEIKKSSHHLDINMIDNRESDTESKTSI